MKNLFTLILTTFLVIGCGSNKKADPALAGMIQEDGSILNVKMDPATVTLYVVNNTDQLIYWHRTMGMDKNDVYDTIAIGDTLLSNSNTQPLAGATSFIGTILPPKGLTSISPSNGNWNYEYGFDGSNTMKINNENDGGGPMPGNATARSATWVYETEFKDGNPSSINNTITFTTSVWPKPTVK
tara:strand:- start:557 stop:1108 length:552 start_codon:yes stop_codon:yes gene_type:complete